MCVEVKCIYLIILNDEISTAYLTDMEATYAEYVDWSEEPIADSLINNYKKALAQVKKYKPYEEALVRIIHSYLMYGGCYCNMTVLMKQ